MKKTIVVEHVCTELESNFDSFTFRLEKALGILMPSRIRALGASPASMAPYLNSNADENKLVLLSILVQNDIMGKEGKRKIKQYQVGCLNIMLRMVESHRGAALYIPIRLLVYEKPDGKVAVEYDLPSSLFAQFDNSKILSDSIALEHDLTKLIRIADRGNSNTAGGQASQL